MSEAELAQYKDKYYVDEIIRQLELEREKTSRLTIQLQQQISRLLVACLLFLSFDWQCIALVVVLWCPALSSSASVTALR